MIEWICPNCHKCTKLKHEPKTIRCVCGATTTDAISVALRDELVAKHREERAKRIREAVAREKRLISWITFFRQSTDIGVGTTALRLFKQSSDREIKQMLTRLLSSCNCKPTDAAQRLNEQYPYA